MTLQTLITNAPTIVAQMHAAGLCQYPPQRPERAPVGTGKVQHACVMCGVLFMTYRKKAVWCSRACQKIWHERQRTA